MVDVIDRDAVEEQQVLVRAAATDIQSGATFGAILHAGEQLQCFQHIGFAEEGGDALDLLYGEFHDAHLGRAGVDGARSGLDDDFLQCVVCLKHERQCGVVDQLETVLLGVKANEGYLQVHRPLLEGDGVEPIAVGNTAAAAGSVDDGRSDQGLLAVRIHDIPADGLSLGDCREAQ